MNQKVLTWGLAIGLLFFLAKDGIENLFSQLSVKFGGLSVENFSFSNLTLKLRITLRVSNTSDLPIPYTAFFGTINYGQYKLSDIQNYQGGIFEPNQSTNVSFDANVKLTELGVNAYQLYQSGELLQNLTLQGKIHADGKTFPVGPLKLI